MSILYLDCGMGAAGDMLTAALLELLPDPDGFVEKLNRIGINGVQYKTEKISKCGVLGTHVHVLVNGAEENEEMHEHHDHHHEHYHEHEHHHEPEHEHDHEHHHVHEHPHHHEEEEHHHHHHHSSLYEIEKQIDGFSVPEKVKYDVKAVYHIIGEAESTVHGVPMTDIHFHEVGTADAVADITAACMLIHELGPDRILCSPVHVGSGTVKCAHGILPVPAPATALILKGLPVYSTEIKGELCTPTGAALLKHFVQEFTEMPPMKIRGIGYGMGKKNFPRLNCVRAILAEEDDLQDSIMELSCNLDDMTGEEIGFAIERILESGAKDVYTVPIMMKKSRPAIKLCVLCKTEEKDAVIQALFTHTSTLGIREARMSRYVLNRDEISVDTEYGTIRKKISSGYGVIREKAEYHDLASAALEHNTDLKTVRQAVESKKND